MFIPNLAKRCLSLPRSLALALATLFALPFATHVDAQTAPRLGLVTRSTPAPAADQAYIAHFRERGWQVVAIDDDRVRNSGAAAVRGFDLVLISSTVFPARVQSRLRSAPEPIIVAEHLLFDDFRMAQTGAGGVGLTQQSRTLRVSNTSHPLTAGFNGDLIVSSGAAPLNYGRVGNGAFVVATASNNANQAVIFAYDRGDALVNGERASGPRIGIHMSQSVPRQSNRDAWALLDAAAAWATPRAPVITADEPDHAAIAPTSGTLLGANVSRENFPSRFEAVAGFERSIGRDIDIINRFHEFSAGLTSNFFWDRRHIEEGRTVMISWRATDNPGSVNGQPDPRRAVKITNGQFDRQIDAMATALRDLEAPVLLRFNWEMDQDVGDPQYIGTPAEFIAAWRYVYRRFEARGATNVEWVWAPRARSFAKNVGPTFYPGADFVDWVGGSAVPINSFTSAQTIYSAWNQWAVNIGKPQLLWVGLRENPSDARWKANFIDELRFLASGQWSGLRAVVYYNSNSPLGFDYTIDTSNASLNAYRRLACDPSFAPRNRC